MSFSRFLIRNTNMFSISNRLKMQEIARHKIFTPKYNISLEEERELAYRRSKVVIGATSVGKLQCHSFSGKERETAQPQFT